MAFNTIIVIFLILAVVWGGVSQTRQTPWGWVGWSTLGFYLLFLAVLFLTGHLKG